MDSQRRDQGLGPLSKRVILPPKIRRSKAGCLSCKTRHVRCDGTLPSCYNCDKKKIECPGYPVKSLKWLSTFEGGFKTKKAYRGINPPSCKVASLPDQPHFLEKACKDGEMELIPQPQHFSQPRAMTSSQLSFLPLRISVMWPMLSDINLYLQQELWLTNQQHCRRLFFIQYYLEKVAPIMSIFDGPSNPFGRDLLSYIPQSMALTHTFIAMSAIHLSQDTGDELLFAQGLKYRTDAMGLLREELDSTPLEVATFAAIVLLGITNSWFNHETCGKVHLEGARALLEAPRTPSQRIPQFIYNAFRWWETLASFVSDYDGTYSDISSFPANKWDVTVHNGKRPPSALEEDDSLKVIDPSLGTWDDLFPYVGQVAVVARRLRKSESNPALEAIVYALETSLLEWQHSTTKFTTKPSERSNISEKNEVSDQSLGKDYLISILGFVKHHSLTDELNGREYAAMGEAYRLSSLITLYQSCPSLLYIRSSLLPSDIAATDFVCDLSSSVVLLLQQIPRESSVLHVSSFPILAAGQNVREEVQRNVMRNILRALRLETKIHVLDRLTDLLEEVWRRHDEGLNCTWLDVLDEWGSEMLIN